MLLLRIVDSHRLFDFSRREKPTLRAPDAEDANNLFVDQENHTENEGSVAEQELANLDLDFPILARQWTTAGVVLESLKRLFKACQPNSRGRGSPLSGPHVGLTQVLFGKTL